MLLPHPPIENTLREYVRNLNRQLVIKTQVLYETAGRSLADVDYLHLLLDHLAGCQIIAKVVVDDQLKPVVLIPIETPQEAITGTFYMGNTKLIVFLRQHKYWTAGFFDSNDSNDFKAGIEMQAIE